MSLLNLRDNPPARGHRRKLLHVLICIFGFALSMQLQAQSNVRPGEQRLNRFQFKTTHNSFERENGLVDRVSITDQLDGYDVWCIEFDLRWHITNDDFYVFHDCADEAGNDTLDSFLEQINTSNRRSTGLTFIYFDSGDIGPCFLYPNITTKPSDWKHRLNQKLTAKFGNSVYTSSNFESDSNKWPSPQELLRRGKHIVPFTHGVNENSLLGFNSIMALNTDEENPTVPDLGNDKFARWYPTGWTCGLNNGGWETAVANKFTFPASNCSDMSGSDLHPPIPTYVGFPTSSTQGRGTWKDPFKGADALKNAIQMVSSHQSLKGASMVNVQINAGTYSAGSRIAAAIRLTSAGGTTRLVP